MLFVTVATHNKRYMPTLIKSIENSGHKLKILGLNEKWGGFTWKYKKMKEFINSLDNMNEIIIFMDAYDVVMINPEKIIDKFLSFNKNIVISQDSEPDSLFFSYCKDRVFSRCKLLNGKNVRINSGLYIGYAWSIKQLLDKLCILNDCNNPNTDDQKIMTNYCNLESKFFDDNVAVDTDNKIFYTFSPDNLFTNKSSYKLINGKVLNKLGNEPNFIHGAGNTDMRYVLKSYNYDITNISSPCNDYVFKALQTYYKYFLPEICFILFIICFILYLIYCNQVVNNK